MSHLSPAHHETSKHVSPNELKIKEEKKQNYPGFEFKACQVNDSSQSNQVTVHLVSYVPYQEEEQSPPPIPEQFEEPVVEEILLEPEEELQFAVEEEEDELETPTTADLLVTLVAAYCSDIQ
jgi:predicted SPOUT superfamily RNA methylase MTH1